LRLVDRLVTDGHEVRILTRSESKAHEKFPERKYPDLKVGGESKWAELIKGSTGVVNLAGPPRAKPSGKLLRLQQRESLFVAFSS